MIFPVILGQISQKFIRKDLLYHIPLSLFGQISLLFIIYSSFCDMFTQDDYDIDAHVLLLTILLGKQLSFFVLDVVIPKIMLKLYCYIMVLLYS